MIKLEQLYSKQLDLVDASNQFHISAIFAQHVDLFDNWHCYRWGSERRPDKDRFSGTKRGRAVKLRYLRGFTMTYKNSTLFPKIDGNLWNMQQNQYRANVFRCTVCFVVGCVATVFLAGSSKLVTRRIHSPRLRLDCGVWSFCFWTHLPTHARSNKHRKYSYVQSHSQICCVPSDLKLFHENSSMQNELAFFQTHMQPHSNIYIDTLRSWFWMLWPTLKEIYEAGSLLSCVCLWLDTTWCPNLNSAQRPRAGVGTEVMRGAER